MPTARLARIDLPEFGMPDTSPELPGRDLRGADRAPA